MLLQKMKAGLMPITILFSGADLHFFFNKGVCRSEQQGPQVVSVRIADDLLVQGPWNGREFGSHDTMADSRYQFLRYGGQIVLHDPDPPFFVTMHDTVEVTDIMEPGGCADNEKVWLVQGIKGSYFFCMVDDAPGMRQVMVGELGWCERIKCLCYKCRNFCFYDAVLH